MIRKDYTPTETSMAREARDHLSNADPVLRRMIDRIGPCRLTPRRDYFNALCESIINQQLAPRAAGSILSKMRSCFPARRLTPTGFSAISDAALREAGVSPQKLRYLRHLSTCYIDGTIPTRRLARLTDEQVSQALTQVLGIGEWTAHMFLIFALNRPDVLATGDLSLRAAIRDAYGLGRMPEDKKLHDIAKPWKPFRSFASWYLWTDKDRKGNG